MKRFLGLMLVFAILLVGCGAKDDSDGGKQTIEVPKYASGDNSPVDLPLSVGVDKNGKFVKEGAGVDAYEQFAHITLPGNTNLMMYGYVVGTGFDDAGETSGSGVNEVRNLLDPSHVLAMVATPCSYVFNSEDRTQQFSYLLFDESLEDAYRAGKAEGYSLYRYNFHLRTKDFSSIGTEESDVTNVTTDTGEANGFPFRCGLIEYDSENRATQSRFIVLFELSDTVRLSYDCSNVGDNFDMIAEAEKIANSITIDKELD